MEEITIENEKTTEKFITNIIFGQKLINDLSIDKKKTVNIDYFLNHIKNFNKQKDNEWSKKINYEKYSAMIIDKMEDKLVDDSDVVVKNSYHIEPYCKKNVKIMTPLAIYKKTGFHYKLVKLESEEYDLFSMIYYNNQIIGYVACGKKVKNSYKNLYVVLCKKYDKMFYDKSKKKLAIMNEIVENISFYEKEIYNRYLRSFRSFLNSIVYEIISENKMIKNLVCIGEEEGGNLLQLFVQDFIVNLGDYNVKIEEMNIYTMMYNSAMSSTETYYKDFLGLYGKNSVITCFSEKNRAYDTWEEDLHSEYNVILL